MLESVRLTAVILVRLLIIVTFALAAVPPIAVADESLGQALKKIFASPTPTPKTHKKKTTSSKKKSSTPTPTPTPKKKATPSEEESPTPTLKKKKPTPTSTPSPSTSPHRKKKGSPTPEPLETPEASASASSTPTPSPSSAAESPTPSPGKKRGAPNATVTADQIKGFDNYPPKVQKLLTSALQLTTQNLDYKYGSADPASGGLDCSGFVYFVLTQNGVPGVPRDSSEQYNWLRRIRAVEPVLSTNDNSYELDDLRPGDILFWTGTYSIERDPPITHTMIYIGREKKSGQRIMVGSSDGRVYQGESRYGVSVFDFNVHRSKTADPGKLHPTFIGYGHIPGLQE